jgi:hypothetical protein
LKYPNERSVVEATTTKDPGLKSADREPDEPETAETPGEDENDGAAETTSETAAHEEEMRAEEERQKAVAEAKDQLSFPIGGIRPATAKIQVTGGDVAIPAHLLPDKDEELEIVCKGWVKTIADRTTKKGVSAERVAIFVVEDVEIQKLTS